ncbi:hypothetical protein [Rhizorhabdus histidinilytica]|uniref:hypothetical protein n=1 Tax=Rhizorhabdus histidinilytica TaxID=439228 RepID=UPI00321FBF98
MVIFPVHRLRPEIIKADVVPLVMSGGTALNGEEDVIQTDGGGRWEISFAGITLSGVARQRLWDAWTSYLRGGARVVLVPVYSLRTAPRPVAGNGSMRPSDLVDDDEVFPTSVRFTAPYIVAATTEAADVRATSIAIGVTQGARLRPGLRFSVGDRAYKIEQVSAADYTAVCTIIPPLREAVASGAVINFDWPLVPCRGVVGQDLAPEMRWGRQGAAAISFVEDFS